jgi:tRNA(Leu) C34 or U34 (ribose-2'-O)-methylase TrmL
MGFSESKFLALAPKNRAKKLADLVRVILLRLGNDWKQALSEYNQLCQWHLGPASTGYLLGQSLTHPQLLDLYQQWRTEAGLGLERDVYLQQDPGDELKPRSPALGWSVLAHNLRSAYNVGSIIRTVDCFGLSQVHLSGYTPDPTHVALRSAARGAETWISCKRWESPLDCIGHYKDSGHPVLALETGDGAQSIHDFVFPGQGLIVLGNEELGIAPELLSACNHKVFIPMHGRKASLNVASAFSILAFALRKG